ncbi:hypothetical protein BX666DRAFT_1880969 [Dichotomocladium elegans]|nr:hypothetical protein BX666DRAFT_1880969 [Dichotomocladium elegans]
MSSNRTLTVQELNSFLHNMDQSSPFMDGEFQFSEFLEACRLIVRSRRSAASSFASRDKTFEQPLDINYVASLIGDVLPAAAAVLGESPTMGTPYLDYSMTPYTPYTPYTPFTPAAAFTPTSNFTPSFEAMQDSPHFSPCMESNDIQITPYLGNSNWLSGPSSSTPTVDIPTFSGDPSQLLLDRRRTTLCILREQEEAYHGG